MLRINVGLLGVIDLYVLFKFRVSELMGISPNFIYVELI
jgi:hypothetical protein